VHSARRKLIGARRLDVSLSSADISSLFFLAFPVPNVSIELLKLCGQREREREREREGVNR